MSRAGLDIPRLRLHNLHIGRASLESAAEVVDWLVAVQAQDYAGAKWALGLRMRAATDALVERAFDEGAILRTHVMRPTWHFVTPRDIRWLLALTAPRVHARNAGMYRQLQLGKATLERGSAAMARALQGGHALTREELREVLERAGITTRPPLRLAYLVMYAELEGVICSGPRRGKQFSYALLEERAPAAKSLGREEALAELARRYFISRGPATVQDLAKWSGLTVAEAGQGLQAALGARPAAPLLEREKMNGREYWFPPSQALDTPNTVGKGKPSGPTAYLVSIYDEYISGYKDRSAIVEAGHGARLVAMGNALANVILIDGHILGTWKRRLSRSSVTVEATSFVNPRIAQRKAVEAAAQAYGEFLERPVELAF